MTIHFSTFVIPAEVLGGDMATPVFVLGSDREDEIARLPRITAMHFAQPNMVTSYVHTTPAGGAVPVSDAWAAACEAYGDGGTGKAKVGLILEPVPQDIETTWASREEGVAQEDMPAWAGRLIQGELRCATRDVRVTSGSILMLDVAPHTDSVEQWADDMV